MSSDGASSSYRPPPAVGEREVLNEAELDVVQGLVGDRWWSGPTDGKPLDTSAQLTLMNARALELSSPTARGGRWPAISCTSTSTSPRKRFRRARDWRSARR